MSEAERVKLMSAAEVAEYLSVAKSTVYQLPITYYKYGSRRVYDLKDVLEYKEQCRRVPVKPFYPTVKLQLSSTDGLTGLQSYFQKRGLRDSANNTIRKKRRLANNAK